MLLAIDAGNTNTVFAVYDDDRNQRGLWRAGTDTHRTADEYAVWLIQLMALKDLRPKDVNAAIISTVVPAALFNLTNLCGNYFNVSPLVVGEPEVSLGMSVNVPNPREVGADRLVNAVAAHHAYGGPLVIIDFGTATTFDVVSESGAYEGGIIAPGVNLSMEALHMAAAKLPLVAVRRPQKIVGTDTVGAMQSGIFWGYVGLIEGLIARIKAEMKMSHAKVVATGGLATHFSNATDMIDLTDKDLTLRGLLDVHRLNCP
ncbi:MAG TPA: type III pantothenate kinase [Alphaproteobacteria bacterium]|nr:type III pantothenate kinase [Alphaproteobacteria bacterium]